MHIDYKEVRKVPIEAVLRQRGIEYRRNGKMLVAKKCPLPSHASKDLFSFKADTNENLWTCHSTSCKKASRSNGGDVIELVMLMDGVGALEAAKRVAGDVTAPNRNGTSKKEFFAEAVAQGVNRPLPFKFNPEPEHPHIQGRGITVETARSYGIGYYRSKQGTASMDDRIIFPLHEKNVLVGYAGRTVLPVTTDNPKWKVGKGVIKTMCFGLDRCDPARQVVLCESCWEVLLARQLGKDAAALIGTVMSDEQEKSLDPFGTVWVMMDDDEAGHQASEIICARLRKRHRVIRSFLKD